MAEAKTRLYQVPEELYDQAWITDYLCEHLRKKVLAGVRIEAKEIGSIGPLKIDDDEDIQATLCMECRWNQKHIGFEIVPWEPEPIEESAPFKDMMKKWIRGRTGSQTVRLPNWARA
jgi:hypothetical protein